MLYSGCMGMSYMFFYMKNPLEGSFLFISAFSISEYALNRVDRSRISHRTQGRDFNWGKYVLQPETQTPAGLSVFQLFFSKPTHVLRSYLSLCRSAPSAFLTHRAEHHGHPWYRFHVRAPIISSWSNFPGKHSD